MSTQRDSMNILFADGTKGLIITEIETGRLNLTATYEDELVYYCADHVGKSWVITRGPDKTNIGETVTRKEAIAQIILDVRKNQVRTANTYILATVSGREFEVVATSEYLAKKCVRFKCAIKEENLITKEIKKADETKQHKARIGAYADIINEILSTPSDEPKTEDEEEAEHEHFVKQMSEPEYMGIDYTDARRFENWKKYLFDRIYAGNTEHDEIYCVIAGDVQIVGWYWNNKGVEQFQRLYGGKIYKVDSLLYYIYEYRDLYLSIMNTVETEEISIESLLIQKDYLHKGQKPAYIFDTLQAYTNLYEMDWILTNYHMMNYAYNIRNYCQMVFRDFAYEKKDHEKTMLAFCKYMVYELEEIIAKWLKDILLKGGDENDRGKSVT